MSKSCIGNINTELCEQNGGKFKCREEVECIHKSNIKGPCNCKYKSFCGIPKQEDMILEEKAKEECEFYKHLEKCKYGR